MGWDKDGRYYTRSRRENGRVVREYIGGGVLGELAAQMDAITRDKRDTDREGNRIFRQEIETLDASVAELNELADLLVAAALLAAGFRQHNRGNWRKRRGNDQAD